MSSLCSSCYVSTFLSIMCTNYSFLKKKRQFKECIFHLVVLHLHICASHTCVCTRLLYHRDSEFLHFS